MKYFVLVVLLVLHINLYECQEQNYNFNADYGIDTDQHNELDVPEGPVYQPIPLQPPPPPADPSIIFVPRIGYIRGLMAYKNLRHQTINAFLGLKYGVVGSGLQRFQKASKPDYLSNAVIDATVAAANCPQFPEIETTRQLEKQGINPVDCLTLNIYAPNKTGLFPVMVFVHGEMLFDGSALEAQPDYLLERDVILIAVNYRLAPFGFLTSLTHEMPGNIALADIHMALEWIQRNIRPFGGDPNQVTLFGQSAGATLVHALTLSNKVNDLVHKVILQSGTALNPYFLDEDPLTTVRTFARLARCYDRDARSLSNCFARLSTTDLLTIFQRHWEENEPRGVRFTGGFKLVIGDKMEYLTAHPAALVANHSKFPLVVGVTKDAGAFILSRFYNQLMQIQTRNISDFINVVLEHTTSAKEYYGVWHKWALAHIFTEEDVNNATLYQLARGLLELVNMILYRGPILESIRTTHRQYPTYLYCFDYRGHYHRFGHLKNLLPFALDAELSDDSIYLFPYPEEVSRLTPDDTIIARSLTTMWYNFAAYGEPNNNVGVWPRVNSPYGPFIRVTNSKEITLELDYHFGDGLAAPNIYAQYMPIINTTTTTTTTTSSPTRPPYAYSYPTRSYPSRYQYRKLLSNS